MEVVLQLCIATSFKPPLLTKDSHVPWKTFGMLLQPYNTLSPLISESIADYGRRCICTGLSPSGMQFVRRVILLVRDSIKTKAKIATMGLVRGTTWIFPNLTSMSVQ